MPAVVVEELARRSPVTGVLDTRGRTWRETLWLVEVFSDGELARRLLVDASTAQAAADVAAREERDRWSGDAPKIEALTLGWYKPEAGTTRATLTRRHEAAPPTKTRAASRKAPKAGTYYTTPDGKRHGPLVLESAEKALRELREWVRGLEEGRAGRVLAHEMGQDHVNELVRINRKEIARMAGVVDAIRAGVSELPRDLVPAGAP